MTRFHFSGLAVAALIFSFGGLTVSKAFSAEPAAAPYSVSQLIKIGGPGGWDYLTVDPEHRLLYVPRQSHTQVVDAVAGKVVADIPGQTGNHGVAIVPELNRGFITDGRDNSVFIFDLKSYDVLGRLKAEPDSDGIIYEPASKKILFVSGDGGVAIPIDPNVDPKSGSVGPSIPLGGKPEFLASDAQGRAFINLVDKNQVAVVDTKIMTKVAQWPTAPGGNPVGMAIDRQNHRLFVGCRNPQKLIIMSYDDGKVLADLPIGAGVDAVQFDAPYILASCTDGTLAVARETSPGKFEIVQTVTTPRGARTMGLDAITHTLYLPTAEMQITNPRAGTTNPGRPTPLPNTFMVVVVKRGGE